MTGGEADDLLGKIAGWFNHAGLLPVNENVDDCARKKGDVVGLMVDRGIGDSDDAVVSDEQCIRRFKGLNDNLSFAIVNQQLIGCGHLLHEREVLRHQDGQREFRLPR